MKYQEYVPSKLISQAVDCLWLLETRLPQHPSFEKIPPDGCSEIIFQLEGRNELQRAGRIELEPRAFLVAQQHEPLQVRIGSRVRNLGIRFRPGGLFSVLGLPMNELVDEVLPLADVWRQFERRLMGRLDPKAPACELFRCTEDALRSYFLSPKKGRRLVNVAVTRIFRTSGSLSVSDLARMTGWSTRQLERRFRIEVGFGPKMLCRIARFQALVRRLAAPESQVRSWADLALGAGYADQAHLIREFRALSGTTPGCFLSRTNPMSFFFNTPPDSRITLER